MRPGLRDVFIARTGELMAAAYQRLEAGGVVPSRIPFPLPDAEHAFNRVFIGPAAVPIPLVYPDDHITFELDCLLYLDQALQTWPDDVALARLRQEFVHAHMQQWIPQVAARIPADQEPDLCCAGPPVT